MKLFKTFFKIGFLLILLSQFSCRKDFDTSTSSGNLSFSVDTLFLDTVFNDLSTTTHLLTVYNRSSNDITVPLIKLEDPNSSYRINVDGRVGPDVEDVLILEKDSIFIFIEATISASDTDTEMLYKDKILFDPNGSKQEVNLVTLTQDATFLFPSNAGDTNFELSETNLTSTKPYLIFGNAIVPENGSLTIDSGSIIYFSENSSLTISTGATLNVNGTLTDSIVFRGDNLNSAFDQVPGQWDGIKLGDNTTVGINHLKIFNPSTGIEIAENTNTININNTEIYNAANYGIRTENANITASNLVIGQSGKSGLFLQGGNYTFNHCTFANFWNKSIRSDENIELTNFYFDENNNLVTSPLQTANFTNCIVSGTRSNEFFFNKADVEPIFNFNFKNCLIDIESGDNFNDTSNTSLYTSVLIDRELNFRNTRTNDLRIGLDNEGINQADASTAILVPLDIIGEDRTTAPDIGAYQHIDFTTLDTEVNE